jgi:hypothetical protein
VRAAATKLFNRLLCDEKSKAGLSHLRAYIRVQDREKTLAALIDGKLTPQQAFEQDRELSTRLLS